MSEAAGNVHESEAAEVVVSRSQFASTMHKLDPDSDDPRPACPQGDVGGDGRERYRVVERVAIASVYTECSNPECFGGDWR